MNEQQIHIENSTAAEVERPVDVEPKVWYAMRVSYQQELKVKNNLDSRGIESFIPMKYTLVVRRSRRVKMLVPIVHDLIFMHVEPSLMKDLKAHSGLPIFYIMNPASKKPVTVPEDQMKNFIAVAGTYDDQLEYLEDDIEKFNRGDRVRIMGGLFEGAEGVLLKTRSKHRVVVSIEGILAVVTAEVHPSLLQKLAK